MARPITAGAAGGLLACAVLFLLAGQSAAYTFPFIGVFPTIFPTGYVPPPAVRIYSKQNTGLNIAVRYDGKVVLIPANGYDLTQLWWKIPAPMTLGFGSSGYWLINVGTGKVMSSPPAYSSAPQVYMADFDPNNRGQVWVSDPNLYGFFYQIKPYTQTWKSLNGLGGAYVGTQIGIWPASTPASSNALWVTTNNFPYY